MSINLTVLSKSYPMSTNMTGFRCFSVFMFRTNVASALDGLTNSTFYIFKILTLSDMNVRFNLYPLMPVLRKSLTILVIIFCLNQFLMYKF